MAGKKQNTVSYENTRLADYTYDDSIERGPVDLPLTLLTLLLLTIGVVMVLSASYARAYYDLEGVTGGNATYYFVRQLLFAMAGVGVMFVCSRFPMGFYRRISAPVLLVAIGFLLAVLVVGTKTNGARRWIDLGFTTFQPSELAKIGVIMYFAVLICRFKEKMSTIRYGVVPFLGVLIVVCGLLYLEPHVSAIMIIVAIGLVMIFVGGGKLWWFIGGGFGAIALLGGAYLTLSHVRERFSSWLDPFADAADSGWQVVQSLYAIGSGGVLGLGLGNSRQKYLYLPEEHNDYIFSVVCEELGYIGAVLILALFALLIIRGYWVAMHARDKYSFLVGVGITTLFALQVILNVAVCTNTIPSTGISLPLFSYGGTALLIQMAELGILLSISRDISEKK
jgi:cell division protein FtsW